MYKGKTLDEIEFSDNVYSDESDSDSVIDSAQKIPYKMNARNILNKQVTGDNGVSWDNTNKLASTNDDSRANTHYQNDDPEDNRSEYDDSSVNPGKLCLSVNIVRVIGRDLKLYKFEHCQVTLVP